MSVSKNRFEIGLLIISAQIKDVQRSYSDNVIAKNFKRRPALN